MNKRELNLMFSSKTSEWETPPEVFNPLHEEFGFTLDVCATSENAKCARYFTKEIDGLKQDWSKDVCWMNPPYGRVIGSWVQKAYNESLKGATVVCLLPARTDTKWFHEYILGKAEIRFVKGRIAFLGEGKVNANQELLAPLEITEKVKKPPFAAPFPSMIVVYRAFPYNFARAQVAFTSKREPVWVSTPDYTEPCYCSVCDFNFISRSPDPICPRCRGTKDLYESKENYGNRPKRLDDLSNTRGSCN